MGGMFVDEVGFLSLLHDDVAVVQLAHHPPGDFGGHGKDLLFHLRLRHRRRRGDGDIGRYHGGWDDGGIGHSGGKDRRCGGADLGHQPLSVDDGTVGGTQVHDTQAAAAHIQKAVGTADLVVICQHRIVGAGLSTAEGDLLTGLESKLSANLDKLGKELKIKMKKVFNDDIVMKQLDATSKSLNEVIHSLFILADIQFGLAKSLNYKMQELNKTVLAETIEYCGYSGLEWHIANVVRIPGSAMFIVLEDGKRFPDDAKRNISYLLKEQVWFVFNTNNLKSILVQAIGKMVKKEDVNIQYIDNEPRIAHISNLDDLGGNSLNRIRLAQQLTGLLIMK